MAKTGQVSGKMLGRGLSRFLYAGFVVLAIGRLAFQGTAVLSEVMATLGIALAFDPFDPDVTWKERPLYQRVWLLVHLSAVLLLMALLAYRKWG